jgi:uncharacterized protein (DUF488 family)
VEFNITTIGFAGKTAEEFFGLLRTAGVKQLIDIRENRGGQLSAFAKYPDLSYFLHVIAEIVYVHEPLLAPSREIRETYRATKDWAQYESRFLELMRDRGVPQSLESLDLTGTIALLCSEPGPEKCHRRLVADILADHLRSQGHLVEISHLVAAETPKPARKRGHRRDNDRTADQRNHADARGFLRDRHQEGE